MRWNAIKYLCPTPVSFLPERPTLSCRSLPPVHRPMARVEKTRTFDMKTIMVHLATGPTHENAGSIFIGNRPVHSPKFEWEEDENISAFCRFEWLFEYEWGLPPPHPRCDAPRRPRRVPRRRFSDLRTRNSIIICLQGNSSRVFIQAMNIRKTRIVLQEDIGTPVTSSS